MPTLVNGLVGGIVATAVMTAVMMLFGDDSPPPPAAFYAKYVGDGPPTDYMPQGMVLHFIYGAIAGAVLIPVAGAVGLVSLSTLTGGIIWGLIWAIVLFVGAAGFWMNVVLDVEATRSQVAFFLLNHLVYGVVLGAWVSLELL